MSIVYIISVIMIYISFLFLKKNDKKLDLITWIVINFILLFCYNTFVCYIYSTISIPINLFTLSILNFILSITFAIITREKRQQYKIDKRDFIVIVVIMFITIFFAYLNFGFPFEIKYVMTDSGVHYNATNNFYQNESLLNKLGNGMMPGAYSNAGILLKVFSPYMEFVDLYKIFISFDIFMFFMTGLLMYVALKNSIKTKYDVIIASVMTIIYMIGYPLNVMIYGYYYLQLGILIFSTLIIIMENFKDKIIDSKYLILILFLLSLELFFSYYLFVPVVYSALFLYYLKHFYEEKKKIINKEFVVYTIITLLLPFVIGFVYNILPGIKSANDIGAINLIGMEGYIYRNLYSNIILFIPFVLIYIASKKKMNFNILLLILLVAYICLLYLGCMFKVVSTYYFYKTYFILWFLLIYLFTLGVLSVAKRNSKCKVISTLYIIIYIILMVVSLFTKSVKINKSIITGETIFDVMDIYGINKTILTTIENDYNLEEIKVLKYIHDNIEITDDTEILILGTPKQEFWFWGIFNYKNREDPEFLIQLEEINKWNENKEYDYLICFNRTEIFKHYQKYIDFDKKLLYSNSSRSYIKKQIKKRVK